MIKRFKMDDDLKEKLKDRTSLRDKSQSSLHNVQGHQRLKNQRLRATDRSEFKTTTSSLQASQLPKAKDKGKAIMVEPERPLKKKDQVALDEEMARNLDA
ncbi:hypothetical protein Tco_0022497 [Tanacetum coccineum]